MTRDKSAENKSAGNKSAEDRSAGNKSAEDRSAGNKSAGNKSAENKSAGNKSAENKSAENKSAEDRSAGNKSAENRSAEDRSAENRSAEDKSAENRSAGNKTKRIICVGNRYFPGDDVGPKVYDFLVGTHFPPDVQLIDGGLMGLDLLRFVDGTEWVVFVDSVSGFGRPGEIVILDGASLLKGVVAGYGHSGGLGYLFRVLPAVCEGQMPDIALIGLERTAEIEENAEIEEDMVERIAQEALRIIERGVRRKESYQ